MKKLVVMAQIALVPMAFANDIDVAFVVDQVVVEQQGREWVDHEIAQAISLSNQTLETAGIEERRVVRRVFIEADGAVSQATLASQGALAGIWQAREEATDLKFTHYDNVVWVVPQSGNWDRVGNAGLSYPEDNIPHIAVASVEVGERLSQLIAHELGHLDSLKHGHAEQHFAETGEYTLMYPHLAEMGEVVITADDISDIQYAANPAEDDVYAYLGSVRPSAPAPLASVTMQVDQTRVDLNAGTVEVALDLSEPLEQSVSVEFFTQSGTATAGDDYEENVHRVEFLPRQTDAAASVRLYTDAQRSAGEVFSIGIRYGDAVSAEGQVELALPVNQTQDNNSGGGSTGPLAMIGLALIALWRRNKEGV
ncbi:hypothetical protein F9L16_04555 [Agarivorans sp. B2Z047]|uniref:SVAGG family GlyGly-CTERM protein n=1 Tax=Agarivorans sp. B2Z047 TaxID=2652721 RepID=UPI00128D4F7C|nr:SVAGG family GlyGly-CTERM protein [Agarivorans sp. B2Z047]MPW28270.1 hypothetical protein [Agarivorans sp. B2Z047]UQN43902.1 SVAGG family GlyGly-CTERM protein [Agarivorans sp. B2Z047]